MAELDLMTKIVSLCKRRGFIFQSSEIYGGLKSCYDYGHLGVELKRNIAHEWWNFMVTSRDNIVGMDGSIMMHSDVWRASGHLASFSDPLVDCKNCKERFRADKAPQKKPDTEVSYCKGGDPKAQKLTGKVKDCGYICPVCGSPELSAERQFNLMFRTHLGPVDPFGKFIEEIYDKSLSKAEMQTKFEDLMTANAVYLRPETAQAMFVQFLNIQQTASLKVPFGIAQIGKSFRNEIVTEHFIFRSCEFEQMEMEFFVEPGSQKQWFDYWLKERMNWYLTYANHKDHFRLRQHDRAELAHYSDDCFDVEFQYPWGWDELEGIASRTDYDLKKHTEYSKTKLSYFDQQKPDPQTGKPGWRYVPYVIEPAAGLTRSVLAFLLDAYAEIEGVDHEGKTKTRTILKLHPRLAPIKVALLPLVKKDGQPELALDIAQRFKKNNIAASYDEQQSIGKRYAKHDEIGTPYCLTIDQQSLEDQTVTIRERDSARQERIPIAKTIDVVKERLNL